MTKKLLAITLVAVMCMTSFVLMYSEDTDADTSTGKIHPYEENMSVYYSTNSVEYNSMMYSYEFPDEWYYYTYDPSAIAEKVAASRDTNNLGDYVKKSDLVSGIEYWAISIGYRGGSSSWELNSVSLRMETIYLPSGSYTIEFTSTNMKETSSRLVDVGDTMYYTSFSNGKGKVDIAMSRPSSFYVKSYGTGSTALTDLERFEWTLEYKISPAPPELKDVTCEDTIKIGTDKVWVKYESIDRMDAGNYTMDSYSSNYYIFAKGSAEEASFVDNVVDKGLADTSGYVSNKITLTSSSYIDLYCIGSKSGHYDYKQSFSFSKTSGMYGYDYVNASFTAKVMTESTSYRFYAGQNFSIGVDFDTSEYMYVMLKTASTMVCMEPGKLYNIKAVTAGEYELYAVMAEGSTANLNEATIKVHTENVAGPDNSGMLFAGVSIGFCAIAFFLLFFFGRRPKWDEMTGLPVSGEVEEVVNEVPEEIAEEASQEIPEEVSEKPPE